MQRNGWEQKHIHCLEIDLGAKWVQYGMGIQYYFTQKGQRMSVHQLHWLKGNQSREILL